MQRAQFYQFLCIPLAILLTQCNPLPSDCEALAARHAEIAKETPGDYYIGRRYYVKSTRFWGYLRRPQESWAHAKLVIMNEDIVLTPDRGPEKPLPNATYGNDNNAEYIVKGRYLSKPSYDPNSNQKLAYFQATSYTRIKDDGGFLFKPSEDRSNNNYVTLFPQIMPSPTQCASAGINIQPTNN